MEDIHTYIHTYVYIIGKYTLHKNKVSIKRPNPQETADLVRFTEEILNGKLHFLCSDLSRIIYKTTYIKPINDQHYHLKEIGQKICRAT